MRNLYNYTRAYKIPQNFSEPQRIPRKSPSKNLHVHTYYSISIYPFWSLRKIHRCCWHCFTLIHYSYVICTYDRKARERGGCTCTRKASPRTRVRRWGGCWTWASQLPVWFSMPCAAYNMPHSAINKTCPRLLRLRERTARIMVSQSHSGEKLSKFVRHTRTFIPGRSTYIHTRFIKRRSGTGRHIALRPPATDIIKCRFTRTFGERVARVSHAGARAWMTLLSMEYIWGSLSLYNVHIGEKWISWFSLASGSSLCQASLLFPVF